MPVLTHVLLLLLLSVDDDSTSSVQARQCEAFGAHSQERIMGLLGAMIPAENQVRSLHEAL